MNDEVPSTISPDDVEAVARLAMLRDLAERLPVLKPQIERMYELGKMVRELDLDGIEPALVYRVPVEEGR